MAMLKVQTWLPDTHPGHIVEVEWEYDPKAGRDTGREHRGVSVRYPDGTFIHRDTDGADVAHEHYQKLHAEHVVKNYAYNIVVETLPASLRKRVLDSDGDPCWTAPGNPCSPSRISTSPGSIILEVAAMSSSSRELMMRRTEPSPKSWPNNLATALYC